MDKFGIFNLLNSFFPLGKTENGQNTSPSSQNSDLLSNLISSLTNNKNPENKSENNLSAPPLPLQNSMLSTINSHDAIVKRVKENSAKHPVLKN